MNSPLSDDNQKQDDAFVWHYTTVDAAFKILSKKQLRATHIRFLNDSMEVRSGFDTIITALKESSKEDAKLKPEEINYFNKMIDQTVCSPSGYYIVSFSDKKDLLTQWQAYTSREGGCAIGFKKTITESSFFVRSDQVNNLEDKEKKKQNNSSNYNPGWWTVIPSLSFCQCEYNTLENKEYLCKKVIEIVHAINNEDKDTKSLKENVNNLFTSCLAGIKDASFQQESEWRLVLKPSGEEIQFDENQRPFFYLKFKNDIDFSKIISEIMISPRGNRSLIRKKLDFLINTLGEMDEEIKITESKLPLQ